MKKINTFNLHQAIKGLDLSTPNNRKKVYNAIEDILKASKRHKNPVYNGLLDLNIKLPIQPRTVIIESDELSHCSNAWKHDFGKKLANDYGLGVYCYVNSNSSKRYLFK